MLRKIIFIGFIVFVIIDIVLLSFFIKKKPSQTSNDQQISQNDSSLPSIKLEKLKITTQEAINAVENKKIQGTFTLINEENTIIPHVSFLLNVSKVDLEAGSGRELIDTLPLPNKVNLLPHETKNISFSYTFPLFVNSGAYVLSITAINKTGLTLTGGVILIKEVKGENNFLEMDWKNSSIIHENEKVGRLTGPTFPKKTSPTVSLIVKNPHDFSFDVIPSITLYERQNNIYTKTLKKYDESLMIIAPTSEKELSFTLPAYDKAESYLAHIRFFDKETKRPVSGIQEFRWVIEGKGPKILSVKSDKVQQFFGKNTASITLSGISSPDGSVTKNVTAQFQLHDESKQDIVGQSSQTIDLSSTPTIIQKSIPLTSHYAKTKQMILTVKLIDKESGEIYDLFEESIPILIDTSAQTSLLFKILILIIIIAIFTIVILFIFRKKYKNNLLIPSLMILWTMGSGTLFFFFFSSAVRIISSSSQRDNIIMSISGRNPATSISYCNAHFPDPPSVTFNSDDNGTTGTVSVGATVSLLGSARIMSCTNSTTTYSVYIPDNSVVDFYYKDEQDDGFMALGIVKNPGSDTVTIDQYVSAVNNCWCYTPGCTAEKIHSFPITAKRYYSRCVAPETATCMSSTTSYTSLSECSSSEGMPCFESTEDCVIADPCPKQPIVLPEISPGVTPEQELSCDSDDKCIVANIGQYPKKCPNGTNAECKPIQVPRLVCQLCTCTTQYFNPESAPLNACPKAESNSPVCCPPPEPLPDAPRCATINDAPPAFAVCSPQGTGPFCNPGSVSTANWTSWTITGPSCGPSEESRTCSCSGGCPIPGCWNGDTNNPQYTSCTAPPQTRTRCISQEPNVAPTITSLTQPDGKNIIQTRRIKIQWSFQNKNGCGKEWGFAETSNFPSTGDCNNDLQINTFKLSVWNSDFTTQIGTTKTVTAQTGNGNKHYTYPGPTDPAFPSSPMTTNTNYNLKICANNGYGEKCATQQFPKVPFSKGTITGNLYEFEPSVPVCPRNMALVGNITATASPSLPTFVLKTCTASNLYNISDNNLDTYSCSISIDNVKADVDTTTLGTKYDILLQFPSLPTYESYYCKSPSLGANSSSCGLNDLNGQKLCTDQTNKAIIELQFDKNKPGSGDKNSTIDVIGKLNTQGGGAGYSFYKLKNAHYVDFNMLQSLFPANPQPFDASDNNDNYFIIGDVGSPNSPPFDSTPTRVGSAYSNGASVHDFGNIGTQVSVKNWYSDVSPRTQLNFKPSDFSDYLKSRKTFKTITVANNSTITSDGIYVFNGTIINQSDLANISNRNVIIYSSGNMTLNPDSVSKKIDPGQGSSSMMFITSGQLIFASDTVEARGVFVGNSIVLGDSNSPLKIIGNMVSNTPIATLPLPRQRTDNKLKPSLFVIFDSKPYIDLLPYLSTTSYQWNELVP